MPKKCIDYSNTIIYKIFCHDTTVTEIYVGYTTNFVQRKHYHKVLFNNNSVTLNIYDTIRNNGGWDNWSMVKIASYNCKNEEEAKIKANEHRVALYSIHNSVSVSVSVSMPIEFSNPIIETQEQQNNSLHCVHCNYTTNNKKDFNKHLSTVKHQTTIQQSSKYKCNCGTLCNSRTTLWRHKKQCDILHPTHISDGNEDIPKEIIEYLVKENTVLRKIIINAYINSTQH